MVVVDEELDVDVAPDRVDEVVPSFAVGVAVSRDCDDGRGRACEPDARCNGQAPAVQPVKCVASRIVRELACLAYA